MCRLESRKIRGPHLRLKFSRTNYKWFWGTNLTRHDLPPPFLANALGLSAVLESSDHHLLFGRRNSLVAYHPNRIHPFAGSAVASDVFAEMRRELAEELNFTADDISDIRCIGMAEDSFIRQPELIFRVRSTLTRRQIQRRVNAAEHLAAWSTPATDNGVACAMTNVDLTPIAHAALHLWSIWTKSSRPKRPSPLRKSKKHISRRGAETRRRP